MPRRDPKNRITQVTLNTPIEDLLEHPKNPRRSDDEAIAEGIDALGFTSVIVAQTGTNFVLAGNGRLRAAKRQGMASVAVAWIDCDERTAERILLGDNRASDLGYYDNDVLATLLAEFDEDDLLGTLYSSSDVDVLLASIGSHADGDSIGGSSDARTPADRAEEYGASPIRSIIIPLTIEDYEATVARLVRLRTMWGVESNAEVIQRALEEAEDAETSEPAAVE